MMELLKKTMNKINIQYDKDVIAKFETYRELVLEWNENVNLTAIKDPDAFEKKHFVDSLICSDFPAFQKGDNVIDIGTGAGFPGVPLAICFPQKQFVLVDSLNKKIKILKEIIDALGLTNVMVLHGRAEDLAQNTHHREKYDICLSRAVAHLAVLSEYCLPFVKVGGYFGAYKSGNTDEEVKKSLKSLRQLGGSFENEVSRPIKNIDMDHQILWIAKTRATPAKYPRKAGFPSKNPIV